VKNQVAVGTPCGPHTTRITIINQARVWISLKHFPTQANEMKTENKNITTCKVMW